MTAFKGGDKIACEKKSCWAEIENAKCAYKEKIKSKFRTSDLECTWNGMMYDICMTGLKINLNIQS